MLCEASIFRLAAGTAVIRDQWPTFRLPLNV
jgi:hypothetical protein